LLYSANNDTVYSSSYGDWIPYSEPIPVVEPVATGTTQSNPPDPLIPTGTSGTSGETDPGTSGKGTRNIRRN
jgi:hypothetical protein